MDIGSGLGLLYFGGVRQKLLLRRLLEGDVLRLRRAATVAELVWPGIAASDNSGKSIRVLHSRPSS